MQVAKWLHGTNSTFLKLTPQTTHVNLFSTLSKFFLTFALNSQISQSEQWEHVCSLKSKSGTFSSTSSGVLSFVVVDEEEDDGCVNSMLIRLNMGCEGKSSSIKACKNSSISSPRLSNKLLLDVSVRKSIKSCFRILEIVRPLYPNLVNPLDEAICLKVALAYFFRVVASIYYLLFFLDLFVKLFQT